MDNTILREDGSVRVESHGHMKIVSATYVNGLRIESVHIRIDRDMTREEILLVMDYLGQLARARWAKESYVSEEWFEHDGSDWPKFADPEQVVQVKFRDGEVRAGMTAKYWHDDDPECNNWKHDGDPLDILRYRVVTP